MTIAATKDNKLYVGQTTVIARLIKKHPETVRLWKRNGNKIKFINGYIIYLDIEKLK